MTVWRRLRDWWITQRTRGQVAERECRHDGSEPWCRDCASYLNP